MIDIFMPYTIGREQQFNNTIKSYSNQSMKDQIHLVIAIEDKLPDTYKTTFFNPIQDKYGIKYTTINTYDKGYRHQLGWRVPSSAYNNMLISTYNNNIILTSPEIQLDNHDIIEHYFLTFRSETKPLIITEGTYRYYQTINDTKTVLSTQLNTQLPFFLGLNRVDLTNCGGYDTRYDYGIGFEDNDLVNRLLESGCTYIKVDGHVTHQEHESVYSKDGNIVRELWKHNKDIYDKLWSTNENT